MDWFGSSAESMSLSQFSLFAFAVSLTPTMRLQAGP
jgi:hypothetical protein